MHYILRYEIIQIFFNKCIIQNMLSKNIFLIILHCFVQTGTASEMDSILTLLPRMVHGWYCSEKVQMIDSNNIFDYMDGAGELYLGYRFKILTVCEYLSNDNNNILVEIYEMDTSDDAFGLLSLDWSGESVFLNKYSRFDSTMTPCTRALYGRGLLRLVSGKYYVRIMATRETVEARNAVIQIGKAIYMDSSIEPEIIQLMPSLEKLGLNLNSDKIAFFRSHMVLNSFFYLSHQNILNLDHSVSAVSATYSSRIKNTQSKPTQILIIEYTTHQKAGEAFNHFSKVFLPENQIILNANDTEYQNYFLLEEDWLACRLDNKFLSLIFNIPNKLLAEQILSQIRLDKHNGE